VLLRPFKVAGSRQDGQGRRRDPPGASRSAGSTRPGTRPRARPRWAPRGAPLAGLEDVAGTLGEEIARPLIAGAAANWAIQRGPFRALVPGLDVVPALSDISAAAPAGRRHGEGGAVHGRRIRAAWSGPIPTTSPEVEARSRGPGGPPDGCPESEPRRAVAEALGSLRDGAGRMCSAEGRRRGPPIRTGAVEPVIEGIDGRGEGSERFRSESGAEAIAPWRADSLGGTGALDRFRSPRQSASGFRPDGVAA
jgi:hypothetical protein